MNERVFYSHALFETFIPVTNGAPKYLDIVKKPRGLWYSCGDAWKLWIENEMPQWRLDYSHLYSLELNLDKILRIQTLEAFTEFEKAFCVAESQLPDFSRRWGDPDVVIDWRLVAKFYAGIEIAPYQWTHRRRSWYNGWDCASGCVWGEEGIVEIKEIEMPEWNIPDWAMEG